MITDALLEELRHRGESSDLDYKADRYPFSKATDEEKSELLKDVIALANTHRQGTAYILIGFRERSPHPAEVVGLAAEGAMDDSRIQQFINAKLEPKLRFHYEERLFEGVLIGVISIPKQQRPFYLKKDYGKLTKDTVYVRRGSATGVASPREIAMMGAATADRGDPQFSLQFLTPPDSPLPHEFEKSFLIFTKDLPDYERSGYSGYSSPIDTNKDYWRDAAEYFSIWQRAILVQLASLNESDFSLTDVHLEITCISQSDRSLTLLRSDDMPDEPSTRGLLRIENMRTVMERAQHRMRVDARGREPVVHVAIGTMRPGQSVRLEDDLVILPPGPAGYVLRVRIFSNEFPKPLVLEHPFRVSGAICDASASDLGQLIKDRRVKN